MIALGGLAQMVERSLCMREVGGSIPSASNFLCMMVIVLSLLFLHIQACHMKLTSRTRGEIESFCLLSTYRHLF